MEDFNRVVKESSAHYAVIKTHPQLHPQTEDWQNVEFTTCFFALLAMQYISQKLISWKNAL